MKIKEARALNESARTKELGVLLREQFNLRVQLATGQTVNTARFKELRRGVARLRTVMNEPQAKIAKAESKKAESKKVASKKAEVKKGKKK